MVRAYKIGSVVVGLAASGLAWGQSAPMPLTPPAAPAGKVITVSEPGKPAQKCRLMKQWTQPSGEKACQVQAVDSGEIMTIVQAGPATMEGGSGQAKSMAMTIYHWEGNTPHPKAPLPPVTMESTPMMRLPAPVRQTSAVQPPVQPGAPATAPIISTPANVSSVFVQQPMPEGTAHGAPMPQGMMSAPHRPPGPMTPGGVVLTPTGSIHDFPDGGGCGECCTECKPSILDRIKGIFHKDCCTTSGCPDACTTCTPESSVPAKTALAEPAAPAPTTQIAPAPSRPV